MDEQDFEDILEIDSPDEPLVDIEDEEEDQENAALDQDQQHARKSTSATAAARKFSNRSKLAEGSKGNTTRDPRKEMLDWPQSLPYPCETLEEFDDRLEFVARRLIDVVRTKDFDIGLVQWNHKLQCLLSLKYPMKRVMRARLARLYYHLSVMPGLDARLVELCAQMCMTLVESKKRIDIRDLVLPWRPLYDLLEKDLFPKQRRTGLTNVSTTLLDLAESAQRFFHPRATREMLHTFLPRMDGNSFDSVIATQAFLVHFLPISHGQPHVWLKMMFRLWQSFESSLWDDQMLDLLARLADMHVLNPEQGDEQLVMHQAGMNADPVDWLREAGISSLPPPSSSEDSDDEDEGMAPLDVAGSPSAVNGESRSSIPSKSTASDTPPPGSLWRDVGIFTDAQYTLIMTKCLRSAGLPVGANKAANSALMAQSSLARTGSDASASGTTLNMKKPSDRLQSFATIIAFSISPDGPVHLLEEEQVAEGSATASEGSTPTVANTPMEGRSPRLGPKEANTTGGVQTFLAGSKAIDHLARFIQATESFFHPSNWGAWQIQLSSLVQYLTWEFLRRIKEEEKPDCNVPKSKRINKLIRRTFVKILRHVCLMSMFAKDPLTVSNSQLALKRMAIIEPDLIVPEILSRAVPSLEALETTHRTTSVISSLGTMSFPITARHLYPEGAKHLVPLMNLCLPGIDLNDPIKTIATSVFYLMVVISLKIDDLNRPELSSNEGISLQQQHEPPSIMDVDPEMERRLDFTDEENKAFDEAQHQLVKMSTSAAEEWAVGFFRRVLQLFEALPEEGKNGRIGGKSEQQVVTSVLGACDVICGSLSPYLFDTCFNIVAEHCASNVSANSVSVVGALIGSFARASSGKVLKRMLPQCMSAIQYELDNGASAVRTTKTTEAVAADTALHWHLHILIHSLSGSGPRLLAHKEELIRFMLMLVERCKNERTYSITSRLVAKIVVVLSFYYPNESHFVNADEWASDEMQTNSHLHWGKLYTAKEAKVSWHVPSKDEIDMVLELFDRFATPLLDEVDNLLRSNQPRDKNWSTDFCRLLSYVKQIHSAVPHLILLPETGGGAEASDAGIEEPEFIRPPPRFKSTFLLKDPDDLRYQKALSFRQRFGNTLLLAAQTTQQSDAEDQIDCVKLLLRSIRSFMTQYAFSSDDDAANSHQLSFYRNMTKLYAKQKHFPRVFWIRRAAFYNTSRSRLNSFHRRRTQLDDELISFVLEMCLSNYVGIRKTAQNSLESITSHFDGTKALSFPKLFEAIKPGVSDDRMKGALYVLGSKGYSNMAILDARFSLRYVTGLLAAQHHSKPSIQKLVRGILGDFVVRFAEPSTSKARLATPEPLLEAASFLEGGLSEQHRQSDTVLLQKVEAFRQQRIRLVDQLHTDLAIQVLEIAQAKETHWAFALYAAKLLRVLVRRDKPLSPDLARYFAEQINSDNPQMRRSAQIGLVKVLYLLKLRTMCKTEEDLVLMRTSNPLKRVEQLPSPVGQGLTDAYFADFASELSVDSKLRDKTSQGWLVWSDSAAYYALPSEGTDTAFDWDPTSAAAVTAAREVMSQETWWKKLFEHLSQEKDRDFIGAETINFIKSIFQVYGHVMLEYVQTQTEAYIQERDRHKHRAAAEIISGVVRGAKHWPLPVQDRLWKWLGGLLPRIFKEATPDSQPAWQMCVEYMLHQRDPRRAVPLVKYVLQTAKDSIAKEGDSPWEQSKAQNLLRGVLVSLDTKFSPWAKDFITLYDAHFASEYVEVRVFISESLADLELLGAHPSFGSVDLFLKDCLQNTGSLLARPGMYKARLERLSKQLTQWRTERVPTSQGSSQYDRAAMTALYWINTTMGDHRNSALACEVIPFLPHIFAMLELHDNRELSVEARKVLTRISTFPYASESVPLLVHQIIDLIRSSKESWRLRLDALPVLQVVYFQNLFYLDPPLMQDIIELLFGLLTDPHLEVREMAATTLSGIVRCSQRKLIKRLKDRFTAIVLETRLPKRTSPEFGSKLVKLHSGLLGATALISAFPYEIPPWMPAFICDTVAQHAEDPVPISTTIRKCAADFKRTHQDTWEQDSKKFSAEQLQEVTDFTLGRSDYFA
ncbi:hypothetical protein K437DRAFT_274941 [Tilletiaria anomala UBC 951]|uniref:ARM repeat-containing protein n=1 Tax=Tilletiaria anomala (strain ATCC 24038 / CBS 436.72 / UBC 951) TaxID=1037660 RepID=A0A066VX28_TILAU|nr:uncharacterized protein K437DRAFT_274941 [Tilletiaria anomala UBC 951]KDN43334.1 hypothetical protein K437DRAFT_274941 [Tilletiaria anomala UBC 951]